MRKMKELLAKELHQFVKSYNLNIVAKLGLGLPAQLLTLMHEFDCDFEALPESKQEEFNRLAAGLEAKLQPPKKKKKKDKNAEQPSNTE
jgi:hypothetical protein